MTFRILQGDTRAVLATLPADTFDCIVTSPPYWGLRDYGVAGQIGLEPTLDGYLSEMVGVCRELRRVLKPSGTFWLNVGDSYAGGGGFSPNAPSNKTSRSGAYGALGALKVGGIKPRDGLKPKDLCMVPNRLAIRLQEDGWYVRSEIIWHKPNPMPESVTDRPTCAHEKVWLLTKSERYAYDAGAIAEVSIYPPGCGQEEVPKGVFGGKGKPSERSDGPFRAIRDARNARNVWSIPSQPFPGAHFATMPRDLAERCIKAGCPVGGHVLDPFGGAGTTGLVADRLGRHATLIELNPAYAEMARNRICDDAPLFAEAAK